MSNQPSPPIYLLHLSDLHLGPKSNPTQYRTQLTADLKRELKVKRLDYLIVSGDVAQNGAEAEYQVAIKFVRELAHTFALPAGQIIIVPGNHDVNWPLSEEAYPFVPNRRLPTPLPEDRCIPAGNTGSLLRDDKLYQARFAPFSQRLYHPLYGAPYPLDADKQGILRPFSQDQLLILSLNSAWECDHYFSERAGINRDALARAMAQVMEGDYDDWLKIAVWHHPVSSLKEMAGSFLAELAANGFQLGLHGHIRRAGEGFYEHRSRHKLHLVGAGSFSRPPAGLNRPFQYNLLIWNPASQAVTVETRKKERHDGVWMADARWGDKNNPKPRYEIRLKAAPAAGEIPHLQPTQQRVRIRISETAEANTYAVELSLPDWRDFPRREMALDLNELNAHSANPAGYGLFLGRALFAETALGGDYREAVAAIQGQNRSLRVNLRLDNAALHHIRWERLHHPINGQWHPLASMASTPFSRYISARSWKRPQPIAARPLRILTIIASPAGLDRYGLSSIAPEESQALHAMFDELPDVQATYLETDTSQPPTPDNIRRELAAGYHIVHFLCHGAKTKRKTLLYLESKSGEVNPVAADDLTGSFSDLDAPPILCFLAACESAAQGRSDGFVPLGPQLVETGGIAAVVAMSEQVSLATAATFAQQFYARLLKHGQVDLAVNEARALVKDRWDWSVPVLFSRLPHNQLLALPGPQAKTQPGQRHKLPETKPAFDASAARPETPFREPTPPDSTPETSILSSGTTYVWTAAELRERLNSLSEERLVALCFDEFQPVYKKFRRGSSKRRKIRQLIGYCTEQNQTGKLGNLLQNLPDP